MEVKNIIFSGDGKIDDDEYQLLIDLSLGNKINGKVLELLDENQLKESLDEEIYMYLSRNDVQQKSKEWMFDLYKKILNKSNINSIENIEEFLQIQGKKLKQGKGGN